MNNEIDKLAGWGGYALRISAILAIAFIASAFIVAQGLGRLKGNERTVTVKGLAEQEVLADQVIWPVKFTEVGSDLDRLYSSIEKKNAVIKSFLLEAGFDDAEISLSPPKVEDRHAANYFNPEAKERFAASSVITIFSKKIDLVRKSQLAIVDLGKQDIALSGSDYSSLTEFMYNGLNEIKPAMIEEATKNARLSAEKFARDSGSNLGKIKQANQGTITISDRDSNTPYIKTVRVVITIDYFLVD
ncbi:SIMPL domain-containing protein [Spirochaetota bacterium]